MKKLLLILLTLSLIIAFTACSKEKAVVDGTDAPSNETTQGNGTTDTGASQNPAETEPVADSIPAFDYLANDLTPYLTLGQYEGLTVYVDIETLTDEEYAAEIEALLSEYAYTPYITEDRASVSGDNLNVNYEGFIDGEAVNNTAAEGDVISITENSGYIPGFVEGFLGHKVGEEFSFDVTFPEDYGNASLAGVTVTFKCSINGIYDGTDTVLPTLEEFVADYTDFESADAFNEYYRSYIDAQLYTQAMSTVYENLWAQIIESTTYHSTPADEVERIYQMHVESYKQYAEMYGVDYETFLTQYVGLDDAGLRAMSQAYVQEDMTLYQLVKELEVEVTDEELNAGCELYAEQYGVTVEEFLSYYDKETIWLSLAYEEVLTIVSESAIIIEE